MYGVLDRIENNRAVILIENIKAEYTIHVDKLPNGSKEGTWFHLTIENDDIKTIVIDQERTIAATKHATSLLEKLRGKNNVSKFRT